jgi:lysophospholipase L1-like esterase
MIRLLLLSLVLLSALACGDRVPVSSEAANAGVAGVAGATSSPHQGGAGSSNEGGAAQAGTAGLGQSAGSGGANGGSAAASGGNAGSASGAGGSAGAGGSDHWVGTWACGPQITEVANLPPSPGLAGNTLRQVLRVSRGGSKLRLRLSNEFGGSPVTMSSVHVAASLGGDAIDPATDTRLSFGDQEALTIAAGEAVFSDAFDFALEPLAHLAVSIRFESQSGDVTGHPGSRTTSFLQAGDAVGSASLASAVTTEHWYFMTGLDVLAEAASGAVVVLGDSITDGKGSTTDQNNRWPDILAERLQASPDTARIGVLNLGIGGNAVLSGGIGPTATQRFDRDVLGQSGARWLIVLEGVNDIGPSGGDAMVSPLIEAYQAFIGKARQAGMLAYGATLLPMAGSIYESNEAARVAVNQWIRSSGAFDAVLDLDSAMRDPAMPTRLLPSYDSGDGLHPSPAGHRRLGEAVDLGLLSLQ